MIVWRVVPRMRLSFRVLPVFAGLLMAVLSQEQASAQLFKWGNAQSAQPVLPRPPRAAARISRYTVGPQSIPQVSYSAFGRWRGFGSYSVSRAQSYSSDGDEEWNGNYKTMCVRLCDGYYFPISYRTTRGRMHRDASLCEASCSCETKLFYLPTSSDNIAHMTALGGGSYGRLETAFKYRLAWDKRCTCRPMPWTIVEQARHWSYSVLEEQQRAELAIRRAEAEAARAERELAEVAEQELAAMRKSERALAKAKRSSPARELALAAARERQESEERAFQVALETEAASSESSLAAVAADVPGPVVESSGETTEVAEFTTTIAPTSSHDITPTPEPDPPPVPDAVIEDVAPPAPEMAPLPAPPLPAVEESPSNSRPAAKSPARKPAGGIRRAAPSVPRTTATISKPAPRPAQSPKSVKAPPKPPAKRGLFQM
jgi:hypothetical protein